MFAFFKPLKMLGIPNFQIVVLRVENGEGVTPSNILTSTDSLGIFIQENLEDFQWNETLVILIIGFRLNL